MAGLNQDNWVAYMSRRLITYVLICAYNVIGVVANLALIASFAPGAGLPLKAAMALSVVAVAVISIMPAVSVFEDMIALRTDRPDEMQGSAFQANYDATPHKLFIGLTIGFNLLVAAVQIWAVFAA